MKKIGLFFGSFNPITIAHLIIAERSLNYSEIEEVWFVISPQNPAKKHRKDIADEKHRLEMVRLATRHDHRLIPSDIEFYLPRPSYTNMTIRKLIENHPDKEFHIICGEDVFMKIPRWRNAKYVIDSCGFIAHRRKESNFANFNPDKKMHEKTVYIKKFAAMNISSTLVRENIKNNKPFHYAVPDLVCKYLKENNLYKI